MRARAYIKDSVQEQIWRLIKVMKEFSLADIQILSNEDRSKWIKIKTIHNYASSLLKTGYVKRISKSTYKLLICSGYKAPSKINKKGLYDHNRKK